MKFKVFHVLIVYFIAELLAFTFFIPFVFSLNATSFSVLAYFLIAYITAVVAIAFGKRIITKKFMIISFIIRILTLLVFIFLADSRNVPFIGVLVGLIFFLFWAPLNFSYFLTVSRMHASGSWKYSFVAPMLSVVLPVIGGVISSYFGLRSLFVFAIPVYLLAIFIVSKVKWKSINYTLKDSLKKFSKLRTLSLIEGFWQPTFFLAIPLITAYYLKSSLKFGGFYSYLGIASALATLTMAIYSDKHKKRKIFIYSVPFVMAFTSIAIAFHDSFGQWQILAGMAYFLFPMSSTFFLAMLLDLKKPEIIPECMMAREFLLNLGRVFGTIVLMAFAIYGNLLHGLAILGLAMFIYPFLVKVKRLYAMEGANVQN